MVEEAGDTPISLHTRPSGYDDFMGIESVEVMYSMEIDEQPHAQHNLIESDEDVFSENDNVSESLSNDIDVHVDDDDNEVEEGEEIVRNISLRLTAVNQVIPHLDENVEQEDKGIDNVKRDHEMMGCVSESERINLERVKEPIHNSPEDVLQQHSKHVFIFTSAGKPVFTRYGDESHFGELFGVFRVLFAVAQQQPEDYSSVVDARKNMIPASQNSLRRITAGNLTFYFYEEGELYYVLAVRNGVEGHRHCFRQLKQLHLQILSAVPNVTDILTRYPSYDLRRLVSPADAKLVRQLIKRNSREESYIFRCLSAAPLGADCRRLLESILSQHFGTRKVSVDLNGEANLSSGKEETKGGGGVGDDEEHHLFSFLFFRGRVICAVGSNARGMRLHTDDALLLLNFTRALTLAQSGESWAPICLPKFNNTGYLWCYCANMSTLTREQRRDRMRSDCIPHGMGIVREQPKRSHAPNVSREETQQEKEEQKGEGEGEGEGERKKEEKKEEEGVVVAVGERGRGRGGNGNQIEESARSPLSALMAHDPLLDRTASDFIGPEGILLVQLATSQEAFTALAEQSHRISQCLISIITDIETELVQRENISLAIVSPRVQVRSRSTESIIPARLAETRSQRKQRSQWKKLFDIATEKHSHGVHEHTPEHDVSSSLTIASDSVQTSVTFETHANASKNTNNSDSAPYNIGTDNIASTSPLLDKDGLQWFAAILKGRTGHEANLVYSAPSVSMRACPQERKRQLRLLARLRDQMAQFSHTAEPLLLVRLHNVCALVIRPIPTLAASLAQQFCSAESDARGQMGISSNDAAAAGARIGELFLLFLPHVTKHAMLACAIRVLVRLVENEQDLSFRQVRSRRDRR